MAQSETDVCNGALQRVGAASVLNIRTDNTLEARQCRLAYDRIRRTELRKHRWNFAIKRVVLAPDVVAPISDFTYQFTLPVDCLRVLLPGEAGQDWVVEGHKILTNEGAILYLRYIADITDPNEFDAAFYDMLTCALAVVICEPITGSNSKKAGLLEEYKEARNEARRNNAFERIADEPEMDSWWTARML